LADNLELIGRRRDAHELFERLLSLRNDVGLLSEEYDPVAKRLVGNFPQAFSHISLVNTATNLSGASNAPSATWTKGVTTRDRVAGHRLGPSRARPQRRTPPLLRDKKS
jgi:hypothetical protein